MFFLQWQHFNFRFASLRILISYAYDQKNILVLAEYYYAIETSINAGTKKKEQRVLQLNFQYGSSSQGSMGEKMNEYELWATLVLGFFMFS